MDKRSRVEGSDKSTNGKNTKEAALDKLRQMEWMRNKQDTWHLARPDSRKEEGYVKKKYNKDDEDSYFEGTGSQKSKKVRKPRQADTTRAPTDMVPTGFARAINSAPPPVNAWAQKKGSALFNKQPEAVDEEDEMLKLVLQESLKTAEEDKRRQMERMKMAMGEMPTFHSNEPPRNDWKGEEEDQYSEVKDQYSPSPAANRDLQFIESGSEDETPPPPSQRRRPPQPRNRKSSNPNDKPPSVNMNHTKPHRGHDKTPSLATVNDLDNTVEPSRPNRVVRSALGNPEYDQTKPPVFNEPEVFANNPQEVTKGKSTITSVNDLSSDLSSNLTFGDTTNLKESNYDDYDHISQDRGNNYIFESKPYEPAEPNRSMPIMVPNSTSSVDKSGLPENDDDTDRIIRSFFRHDPPLTLDNQGSSEFYAKHNPQLYFQNDPRTVEQNQLVQNGLVHDNSHSVLKNSSGQDLKQSESNSPLQNVSPYGSFGKETLAGLPQNVQQMLPPLSLPYPVNIQSNHEVSSLHAMQLAANHSVASQMTYGMSSGYPFLRQTMGSIPPGLNQFGYPNSNALVPPNLRNITPQQLTMNAFQHQQAQLTMETIQSEPKILQNQPQIMMSPGDLQAQMTLTQSHLQMLQQARLQMHSPVNQLIGNTGQKPGELAHETKQISPEQGIQQPTNKSIEELKQAYVQTMQYLDQLSQEIANSSVQPVAPNPQLYNYPGTLPMPIGSDNNMLYPGVQMPTPSQPIASQHATPNIQQPGFITQPSQGSPNIQQGFPDLEAIFNMTGGVGPTQPSSHAAIGRGRGRIP